MNSASTAAFGAGQAVALGAIMGGWFVGAGQHSSSGVWPWLSLSLAGLTVSLGTNAVALFTFHQRIRERFAKFTLTESRVPSTVGEGSVSGTGMTLFHRPDCILVAGKDVIAVDRAGDLQACGMCRP
ncbi:MAG: hypothetical protein QOD57_1310 [Actinomycetota bacterium]|nr:hypothetical protein [Actinomycetota bacterium]